MDLSASYPLRPLLASLQASVGGIWPELVLIAGFLLAILLEITVGKRLRTAVPIAAMGSLGLYLGAVLLFWPGEQMSDLGFLHMIQVDRYAAYMKLLIGFCSLLAVLAAQQSVKLRIHSKGMGEYYLVLLGMTVGMVFMTMARNLLMMYIALEMVSLPAYALTAYARMKQKGAEAALKYVIYGCFASGLMLYGISWIYGFTGTFDPLAATFGPGLQAAGVWPVTMAMAMVLGGFAFKIGALPFHFWMPDVMEGAPHSVASLFSVAPKVAGFAMLIRWMAMLQQGLGSEAGASHGILSNIHWMLAVMAIGSMLLGNLAALRQDHFRRMLAYSAIALSGLPARGRAHVAGGWVCGGDVLPHSLSLHEHGGFFAGRMAGRGCGNRAHQGDERHGGQSALGGGDRDGIHDLAHGLAAHRRLHCEVAALFGGLVAI